MKQQERWPSPTASLFDCDNPLGWMERAIRQKAKHGANTGSGAGLNIGAAVIFEELKCQKPNESLLQMSERIIKENSDTFWPTPKATHNGEDVYKSLRRKGSIEHLQNAACMSTMDELAWPSPTTQDGKNAAGPSQFSRNTLPLNAEVFREFVLGMTREQISSIINGRRLNPAWVENLMGWPIGWTDLKCDKVRVPISQSGEYTYPAGRHAPQKPHEPPRITAVKARSPAASARNSALKQLGNGWVPQQAARAFEILEKAIEAQESKLLKEKD